MDRLLYTVRATGSIRNNNLFRTELCLTAISNGQVIASPYQIPATYVSLSKSIQNIHSALFSLLLFVFTYSNRDKDQDELDVCK